MARPRISSELEEARALLGQIVAETGGGGPRSRGERLQRALAQMCQRGGLRGAAIVDEQGLPLATHACPFRIEVIGAFASVLGEAQARAGAMLGRDDLDRISLDLGVDEKAVVRRFEGAQATYHLVVVCPQALDERAELEVSLPQLRSIVAAG
jgi:predicted regulator of Ras-like GTPase activity (Roadblock/LC7/MglB family)